jgi:hypothetical protein
MIGWCDGLWVAARIGWWQFAQMSSWFGRKVVTNLLMEGASDLPWMLWQLLHETSFSSGYPRGT